MGLHVDETRPRGRLLQELGDGSVGRVEDEGVARSLAAHAPGTVEWWRRFGGGLQDELAPVSRLAPEPAEEHEGGVAYGMGLTCAGALTIVVPIAPTLHLPVAKSRDTEESPRV